VSKKIAVSKIVTSPSYGAEMKSITIFVLLSVATLSSYANAEFKVGVVAPLSGMASSSGISISNSIVLASKKFDSRKTVEFIYEDDQLAPRNTVTAVNKLIKLDNVNALIVFGTSTSLAVNSIAEANKIPMIALSIDSKVVDGKYYVFKHWVSATVQNDLITSEVEKHDYNRVAVVSTVNDAMLKLRDLFKKEFPERVVADEEMNKDDTDFKTVISKILSTKPEAIYNLLWSPQPGLFARKLREDGYKGVIFGVHNIEDPGEIASSRGALLGSWLVSGDDSGATEYHYEYFKTYHEHPTAGGINAYDVAKILIEGANSLDLPNYIRNLKGFKGAYGQYNATGKNDFEIPAAIKIVTKDGFKFLD